MNDLVQRAMMRPNGGGGLPAGYIPCESIGTNGYSVFIDSLITPLPTMSFEAEVAWVGPSNAWASLMGYYLSASNMYCPIQITAAASPLIQLGYGNNQKTGTSAVTVPKYAFLKYKVVMTPTGATVEIYRDEQLLRSASFEWDTTTLASPVTMALLGRKPNSSSITDGSFRGNGGRIKMYSDDHFGNLIADFQPCYNGTYFGYYDLVARRFLQGSAPGSIIGFGEYWGTGGGFLNNTYDKLADDRGYVTSGLYAKPAGCTSVRFNCSNMVTNARIWYYSSNMTTSIDYFNYNTADRVVSVPANVAYFRIVIPKSHFRNYTAYIYDNTNKQYIFRAINASIPE